MAAIGPGVAQDVPWTRKRLIAPGEAKAHGSSGRLCRLHSHRTPRAAQALRSLGRMPPVVCPFRH